MRGNERADLAAKSALDKFKIPYTNLKPEINRFIHTKWQKNWNNNIHNKLFLIKPTLGDWRPALRKSRKRQVTISQLHICHKTSWSFLLKQKPQGTTCQTHCTVKHFLIECKAFTHIRICLFSENNMKIST